MITAKSSLSSSLTIKVYSTTLISPKYCFYIQRCGDNGGRPLETPLTNSFLVSCLNQVDRDQLFWLCNALWQTGAFSMYVIGTAIPFIRLSSVRKVILGALENFNPDKKRTKKLCEGMNQIQELEITTQRKLTLIRELRVMYLREYLK